MPNQELQPIKTRTDALLYTFAQAAHQLRLGAPLAEEEHGERDRCSNVEEGWPIVRKLDRDVVKERCHYKV